MYLTKKQQLVYDFICSYIQEHDISPSFEDIRVHFGFRSLATVADYVRLLRDKGPITGGTANSKRSLVPASQDTTTVSIPLLGSVAAGPLSEAIEVQEYFDVPKSLLADGDNVALKVKGESMIENGIYNDDIIIIHRQDTVESGDIAVVLVDDQATLKTVIIHPDHMELRPGHPDMKPIIVAAGQNIKIYGVLVSLYRKF